MIARSVPLVFPGSLWAEGSTVQFEHCVLRELMRTSILLRDNFRNSDPRRISERTHTALARSFSYIAHSATLPYP